MSLQIGPSDQGHTARGLLKGIERDFVDEICPECGYQYT